MRRDAQIIIHQGILNTFLQHNSTHRSLGMRSENLQFGGEEAPEIQISYKALERYAYQDFASSLCNRQGNLIQTPINVAGWLNPGAVVRHIAFPTNTSFEEPAENAFVLLFAPVACYYYRLQSRLREQRAQYVLVAPDIVDLEAYAEYRQHPRFRYYADCQDFYACGLGDAGLRFLTGLSRQARRSHVSSCQVITLGTVAWASQQKTRTDTYVVHTNAEIRREYQICSDHLPDRPVQQKDGTFISSSFARELITENLSKGLPWHSGFADKVNSNDLFQKLTYERGGLHSVVQKIWEDDDLEKLFVQVCHEAIRYTYGQLSKQAKQRGEIPNFDRETVRFRTSLSRCKTAQSFRELMTDFWARAGKLPTLQKHWADLMQFVMKEKQWKKSRDLALLALASYSSKDNLEDEVEGAFDEIAVVIDNDDLADLLS
jgi:CRISPR-associated protein Cas8a1/Csx13